MCWKIYVHLSIWIYCIYYMATFIMASNKWDKYISGNYLPFFFVLLLCISVCVWVNVLISIFVLISVFLYIFFSLSLNTRSMQSYWFASHSQFRKCYSIYIFLPSHDISHSNKKLCCCIFFFRLGKIEQMKIQFK